MNNLIFHDDFDFFKSFNLEENGQLIKVETKLNNLEKIKNYLIDILQKQLIKSFEVDLNEELLLKGKSYPVGTVRDWQGKKFKKVKTGKWMRLYETQKDKGINIAISKTIKKIQSSNSIEELAEIVSLNKKRFLNEEKTSPIVKQLLEMAKERRESFKIKESEKENSLSEILGKEGFWNGKIYGNERYGYRVYIDSKEIKISEDQKNKLLKYKEKEEEKKNIQREEKQKEKEKQESIEKYKYIKERAIENTLNNIEEEIKTKNNLVDIHDIEKKYINQNNYILNVSALNGKSNEENFEMIWKEAKEKYQNKIKSIEEFENNQTDRDNQIKEQLLKKGGKYWESYGKHRIYFNDNRAAELFGLDVSRRYKTGSISGATLNGNYISNSKAGKIINSFDKFHYDLDNKKFGWSQNSNEEMSKELANKLKESFVFKKNKPDTRWNKLEPIEDQNK